jgi:hypothetical protein
MAMVTRKGREDDENQPIRQDMMNVTPYLGQAKIKLNMAPDVTVDTVC